MEPATSAEVQAAREVAAQALRALDFNPAYRQLDFQSQQNLRNDLARIRNALEGSNRPALAMAQATPHDRFRRGGPTSAAETGNGDPSADQATARAPKAPATETIAARTGALIDEVNFVEFVTSLVHGTFDAMLDATIRQMEAFADLVSSVAKDIDRFTAENVTDNQAMDWLVEKYPRDLVLEFDAERGGLPAVRPRHQGDSFESDAESPVWMADYGLEGEPLTDEVIQTQLVPTARKRLGESRLQMLATMVLMGMNRIVVRDGTVSAKVRFRSAARDLAKVDYAVSQDPGGETWGSRGSNAYAQSTMMISTLGANAQADSDLRAELYGEVKINFESETLPLDQFVDAAQMAFLRQNAKQPIPETTETVERTPAETETEVTTP